MEGYLKKWINLLYRWQNRYFILHEGVLIYCMQKGSAKKGQVHLSICSIRAMPNDPLRIIINYGMSEMHLRASSVQEKQKWLEALMQAQEKYSRNRQSTFLSQKSKVFNHLEGLPEVNLNQIHTTLTKLWVSQAQLEEKLSTMKGKDAESLRELSQEIKLISTQMAQQVDEEFKKLVVISEKLKEKLQEQNEENDNPPDNPEDELENEQNHTLFQSFGGQDDDDDSEFKSFCDGLISDERLISPKEGNENFFVHQKGLRQEQTEFQQKRPIARLSSFIPVGEKPIIEILERIKQKQPIKYNNMRQNEAFKDMTLGIMETREKLPAFRDPNEKIRLFSVIKDMVGKDLTKITFPVTFNEPLSMLQNFAENLEYSDLLDIANKSDDSCLRMAYVMAFGVSSYSSTIGRIKKPFNPIQGETFEFVCPKFRYLSEQVSHHPPISAGFAENDHFEFYGDSDLKTTFWGKSIEVTPLSKFHVILKKNQDHIIYQKCKSAVKNLIIGEQYLDHYGEIHFINQKTGDIGVLNLIERGWTSSNAFQMNGQVKDKNGIIKFTLKGKWDSSLSAIQKDTNQEVVLWKRNQLPLNYEQQYFFTQFAIGLNHLNQQLLYELPTTDSRFRPDQRAYENCNIDVAAIEKTRLEGKQRQRKKDLQSQNIEHTIMWFNEQRDPITNERAYIFNKNYWKIKNTAAFHQSQLDIF